MKVPKSSCKWGLSLSLSCYLNIFRWGARNKLQRKVGECLVSVAGQEDAACEWFERIGGKESCGTPMPLITPSSLHPRVSIRLLAAVRSPKQEPTTAHHANWILTPTYRLDSQSFINLWVIYSIKIDNIIILIIVYYRNRQIIVVKYSNSFIDNSWFCWLDYSWKL